MAGGSPGGPAASWPGEAVASVAEFAQSSLFVFRVPVHYDGDAVEAHLRAKALEHLRELHERLQRMTHFDVATLEKLYRDFAAEKGLKLGDVAQPTRVALTGRTVRPPLFHVMELVGREICLERLEAVLQR